LPSRSRNRYRVSVVQGKALTSWRTDHIVLDSSMSCRAEIDDQPISSEADATRGTLQDMNLMAKAKISVCRATRVLRQFRIVEKRQKIVNMGTQQPTVRSSFH